MARGWGGIGGHSSPANQAGYWEALRLSLEFRRVHVLPVEAELRRQQEQIAADKRAAEGKLRPGEIIGPPNPYALRKSFRPRMK